MQLKVHVSKISETLDSKYTVQFAVCVDSGNITPSGQEHRAILIVPVSAATAESLVIGHAYTITIV